MAKLIFSLDGAYLGEFSLDKPRLTIGRKPGNDIAIDNLAISGEHAAVTLIGDEVMLEDLGSTNGTLVNGNPVKKYILQHGDTIGLGKYQLKYVNEAVINALSGNTAADFDKTMVVRPSSAAGSEQMPPLASPAAELKKPAQPLARIQVLTGPGVGKEMELAKSLVTIGKPGVQVAVITRRPHGYFITHVEGTSHPVVNGNSIGAEARPLNDHDVIELAGVKMEFYLVPN